MKPSTFWSLLSISAALILLKRRSGSKRGGSKGRDRKMIVSLVGDELRVVDEIAFGQKLIWEVGDGLSQVNITFDQGKKPCRCGGNLQATPGHDAVCEVCFPDGSEGMNSYTIDGTPIDERTRKPVKVKRFVTHCPTCKP